MNKITKTIDKDIDISTYLPQCYEITNGNQFLYAVGVAHLFDINYPQFKVIKNKWKDFLKITKSQNCIVLVEGGKSTLFSNLKTAVSEAGENGFITRLAAKEGIDTFSPEPAEIYEVNQLLKKFSKDQIMFYYFSRLYVQWFNACKPMMFKDYIQRQFDQYRRTLSWRDYNFQVSHFVRIHNERRDHKFNKDRCMYCIYEFDTDIKDVEISSVKLRDKYIFKEICRIWNSGKSIFVVYGGLHIENWKNKLERTLIK